MSAELQQKTYILQNLGCANCAAKMERKIQALPDVESASIIFATKQLRVEAPDPAALEDEMSSICQSIEGGVYLVEKGKLENSSGGVSEGHSMTMPSDVSGNTSVEAANSDKATKGFWGEHKKDILTLTIGAVLFAGGVILKHTMPDDAWFTGGGMIYMLNAIVFIAAYILLGYQVLLTAARNIGHGQVFDENFLMSIATIAAFCIGDFAEGVGVMLFYRVGELFEDIAVEKSRSQIMDAVDMRPETVMLVVAGEDDCCENKHEHNHHYDDCCEDGHEHHHEHHHDDCCEHEHAHKHEHHHNECREHSHEHESSEHIHSHSVHCDCGCEDEHHEHLHRHDECCDDEHEHEHHHNDCCGDDYKHQHDDCCEHNHQHHHDELCEHSHEHESSEHSHSHSVHCDCGCEDDHHEHLHRHDECGEDGHEHEHHHDDCCGHNHNHTQSTVRTIPAGDAKPGDILLVRPGDRIPLDGIVTEGESRIDTSPVTGEPVPVSVYPGSEVTSGCLNEQGVLKIRVTKPLTESMVTRILDSVENAAAGKPKIDKFITKFARIYTPIVVALAVLTAVVPSLITGNWALWIKTAITFLVISCPCALVISVPLAFFAGIGAASKLGILFKGGLAIESLKNVKAIVMDKTGTITKGVFEVDSISTFDDFDEADLLSIAAACEANSSHPIAVSIIAKSKQLTTEDSQSINAHNAVEALEKDECCESSVLDASSESLHSAHSKNEHKAAALREEKSRLSISPAALQEISGMGIKAELTIIGELYSSTGMTCTALCGNRKLMTKFDIALPELPEASGTEILVALDGIFIGRIIISDKLKEDSVSAISHLKSMGLTPAMLTGDNMQSASAIATVSGITTVRASLLPEDKVSVLKELRGELGAVMFVGDGINDAPVLAGADVGAAMGAGADAAIEAADVVFMNSSLTAIPQSVNIARYTGRIAMQNIVLALAIKLLVIILGLIGLANIWAAVFADTGVAMLCILNSLRVMWKKYDR